MPASRAAQWHLADPVGYRIYGLFIDYAHQLQRLFDADDHPHLARYFTLRNLLLTSPGGSLQEIIYERVIGFITLSRAPTATPPAST